LGDRYPRPSPVPLALVGTFAVLYENGLQPRQSLADGPCRSRSDSWSTTPSSRIENITRHLEEGLFAVRGGDEGDSGEIGFTVMAITFLADRPCFIPLFP